MNRACAMLRNGEWLTRERIRLVAIGLIVASSLGILFLVLTAHRGVDLLGRPLGTDFSDVYAAGTYVLDGKPDAPFNLHRQYAREQAIFGPKTPAYGWHYPPYFLFIAAAVARMPYGLALAVWQASTLALYLLTIWAIVRSSFAGLGGEAWPAADGRLTGSGLAPDWFLLALAFPAVLVNLGHGQNGFLTAALLGGALVLLDRRPLVAGILFGLLIYKPQFGLLIPIALAAGGRWRSFAAAAVTVVIFTLATGVAFGPQVWHAFAASTGFTRTVVLEQGNIGWPKIQSLFSWARMWGAPVPLAYALQGVLAVALGGAIAWLWRSDAARPLKAAGLCLAAILATPYALDYDMMVLAPAIVFVAGDGLMRGFLPWENTVLAALWLAPLVSRTIAHATMIPLGVPAMLAAFFMVVRRAQCDRRMPGRQRAGWTGAAAAIPR